MKNEIIVEKIIAYTDKLLDYCDGLTAEQFFADTKLVEACVFNLEQKNIIWATDTCEELGE